MVYDSVRNLLFIHIPKNAGKSIELSLNLVNFENEKKSNRSLLNRFFRLGCKITQSSIPKNKLYGTYDYVLASQHLTFLEIKLLGLIDDKQLKNSFKFAVVRNPWSRAVSIYNHVYPKVFNGNFEEFCDQWFSDSEIKPFPAQDHNILSFSRLQSEYIVDRHDQIVIDMILRFENLSADFRELCNTLKIDSYKLQHYEKIKNSKHLDYDYRDYYSEKSKKKIQLYFEEDIDRFKYTF